MSAAVTRTDVPGYPVRRGKVRDVYDLGTTLAVVATDRISAFDWVLPTPIPGKGRVLTAMTAFWLGRVEVAHHLLSTDVADLPEEFAPFAGQLEGRTMLVQKTEVVPFECVVRGYLAGSGWKDYQATGSVCGVPLPAGLREAEKLPEPIFTPAIKAESGHDQNVPYDALVAAVGEDNAAALHDLSVHLYTEAANHALARGILVADTKFEWGVSPTGMLTLIDEVLTPDSSRFWPADEYAPGGSPPSFDKQYVRDWLLGSGWDRESPPPELPPEVVARTAEKYAEALRRLTA